MCNERDSRRDGEARRERENDIPVSACPDVDCDARHEITPLSMTVMRGAAKEIQLIIQMQRIDFIE
jgi:hypothetical protein